MHNSSKIGITHTIYFVYLYLKLYVRTIKGNMSFALKMFL